MWAMRLALQCAVVGRIALLELDAPPELVPEEADEEGAVALS